MELRQYFLLARRWAWLLILGSFLGGVGAYVGSLFQTPIYQASSQVMVSPPSYDQLSEFGYLSGYQLINTYAQLITTAPVLEDVSNRVNYVVHSGMIDVRQIRDTQILEVKVEDTDPIRAAVIATLLIDALIANNEVLLASRFDITEDSLQTQIVVVEVQIENLQSDLSVTSLEYIANKTIEFESKINDLQTGILDIEAEIVAFFPEGNSQLLATDVLDSDALSELQQKEFQLDQKQAMLDLYEQLYFDLISSTGVNSSNIGNANNSQSQTTLALYQQIYSNLLSDLAKVRLSKLENTPTVVQIEPATPPDAPIRPNPLSNAMLGIVVGIMIAAGIIFLIEYMDDRIKSPEDIVNILESPPIGYISEIKLQKNNGSNNLLIGKNHQSLVEEEFRSLRTNVEFINSSTPIRTILITSPSENEGKSTIASNLAMTLIQNNKRVVLIDGDMRRPTLHRVFNLGNRVGLSEYLRGKEEYNNIGKIIDKSKRLLVIPSGKLPRNPAELLNTNKLLQLFSRLEKVSDYILIDSPPLLVTDPVILSAKTDGVLIVTQIGQTRKSTLQGAVEQLTHAKSRILGIVFNRISAQTAYYYQYNYSTYYKAYRYSTEEDEKEGIISSISKIIKNNLGK